MLLRPSISIWAGRSRARKLELGEQTHSSQLRSGGLDVLAETLGLVQRLVGEPSSHPPTKSLYMYDDPAREGETGGFAGAAGLVHFLMGLSKVESKSP